MLGKLFIEDIESLDFSSAEALKASGANKTKTLVFAVIPQILPSFLSLILYRFELNLRSASILGLIGAGVLVHHDLCTSNTFMGSSRDYLNRLSDYGSHC